MDVVKSPQVPTISKSLTPVLDEVKPMMLTLPNYSMPPQVLSSPPSPFTPSNASTTSKGSIDGKQLTPGMLSAQYIVCCKCGKHRAVPS